MHLKLTRQMRRLSVWSGVLTASAWGFARYRAWHLRWGATDAEVAAPMPGDDLLPGVAFCATRAVTIDAPPSEVWPWLVQVGFGRAGFYSYDWADNLGRPSARLLLPEYQSPRPGDVAAPMVEPADDRTAFRVVTAEEPHVLVWAKPDSTWAWRLTEDAGRTRLVTRLKAMYQPGAILPITVLLMEMGDFPMMRRMLRGLAERAEATSRLGHQETYGQSAVADQSAVPATCGKSVRPALRGGQDCGMADKQWFAVRTIVANNENRPWGPTNLDPGQIDYEERITIWRAENAEAAIALAEAECQSYVEDLGGDMLGLSQSYALAMKPGHGIEVFSLIRRSELLPDQYLDRHFDTGTEHQSTAG